MKKDVLIVAPFADLPSETGNCRYFYLADQLAGREDVKVELVISSFSHLKKAQRDTTWKPEGYGLTYIPEPGYPKNVCLRRFASHRAMGRSLARYLAGRAVPDVVLCATPSLDAAGAAADYCRSHGVRFIVDIQDLWPEAFQMVVPVPVLFAPWRRQADAVYAAADEVVAVSRTYVDRALSVNRKCREGHTVFLGTNLRDFDEYAGVNPVFDKPAGTLWLGYCGTLGSSYDLSSVIDALALLKDRGKRVPVFQVMGDGPRKEEFESYAARKGVEAHFTGRLPYAQMCGRLCACDVVVNPIAHWAAQSIINKHADYAASGLPVISTQECPEYRDLVEEYRMGFNCVNGDAADLADKLLRLMEDEALRREMGANARRCAEERFDRANSYGEIVNLILE